MQRKYPSRPIVAIGGIVHRDSKILLSKRRDPPDKFMWSIPGGAVEKGETLFVALKREMKEECGIEVKSGTPFIILDKIYKNGDIVTYHYVIVDFFIDDFSGNLEVGSDSLALNFFALDNLRKPDIPESVSHLKEYIEQFMKSERLVYLSFEESFK